MATCRPVQRNSGSTILIAGGRGFHTGVVNPSFFSLELRTLTVARSPKFSKRSREDSPLSLSPVIFEQKRLLSDV